MARPPAPSAHNRRRKQATRQGNRKTITDAIAWLLTALMCLAVVVYIAAAYIR